ncbi:hypothetical protein LCGC14_2382730 [marine sediment metagenome]|uniref:Uncharacterized protein n=1 Tax=marine sediment metagenome TaxID=412755 RepID=A0A0F9EV26_9ZZZZ
MYKNMRTEPILPDDEAFNEKADGLEAVDCLHRSVCSDTGCPCEEAVGGDNL